MDTRKKLETAHHDLADVTGKLALMLASGRGLSRVELSIMMDRLERAQTLLRSIAPE